VTARGRRKPPQDEISSLREAVANAASSQELMNALDELESRLSREIGDLRSFVVAVAKDTPHGSNQVRDPSSTRQPVGSTAVDVLHGQVRAVIDSCAQTHIRTSELEQRLGKVELELGQISNTPLTPESFSSFTTGENLTTTSTAHKAKKSSKVKPKSSIGKTRLRPRTSRAALK